MMASKKAKLKNNERSQEQNVDGVFRAFEQHLSAQPVTAECPECGTAFSIRGNRKRGWKAECGCGSCSIMADDR